MLRNDDDDAKLGKAIPIDGTWIQHAQDQSWSASSSKSNIRFVGSSTMLYWESHNLSIQSTIEVNEHLMESLFDKLSNRSCPTQYHVGKASNSSRHAVDVSTGSYIVVMGLSSNLGKLTQVGAFLKYVENTLNISLDVLLLGHLLRRLARASGGPILLEFESTMVLKTSLK
jgi:hypothetical protein